VRGYLVDAARLGKPAAVGPVVPTLQAARRLAM
jgi:hypothetical protein